MHPNENMLYGRKKKRKDYSSKQLGMVGEKTTRELIAPDSQKLLTGRHREQFQKAL